MRTVYRNTRPGPIPITFCFAESVHERTLSLGENCYFRTKSRSLFRSAQFSGKNSKKCIFDYEISESPGASFTVGERKTLPGSTRGSSPLTVDICVSLGHPEIWMSLAPLCDASIPSKHHITLFSSATFTNL